MIYLETQSNKFEAWIGEPINGIQHPRIIERVWSDDELNEIGLYRPAPTDPIAEGRTIVKTEVKRVNGVVKFVHTTIPIQTEEQPTSQFVPQLISRRQFFQGLAYIEKITKQEALDAAARTSLPANIMAIVNGMTDEDAKFQAHMLLLDASEFDRGHPLVLIFAIAQQMSEQEMDDFWVLCSTL